MPGMRGVIDQAFSYIADNMPVLTMQSYDLGVITFTAGTIGSNAGTIQKAISKAGYTPIAMYVRYVSAGIVRFAYFTSADKASAYIQVIRGQSGAYSGTYHAYLEVLYIKN